MFSAPSSVVLISWGLSYSVHFYSVTIFPSPHGRYSTSTSPITVSNICVHTFQISQKLFYFGFALSLPSPVIKHLDDHMTFNGQFSGVSRPRPWFLATPKSVCKDPPTAETSQVVPGPLAHHSRKGSQGRRKWYLRRSTARDKICITLMYLLLAPRAG